MSRNKTIRQTVPRAKNVHASAQRDIYVTGLYSSGKHRINKQTINNVCLGSTYTEYIKKVKILKIFFSGQRWVTKAVKKTIPRGY